MQEKDAHAVSREAPEEETVVHDKEAAHEAGSRPSTTASSTASDNASQGQHNPVTATRSRGSLRSQAGNYGEVDVSVPGHDLDNELARGGHTADELQRIETRGTVRSKMSRVVSAISRRKTRDRIMWEPVPQTDLAAGVVGWEGQSDPQMPFNYSARRKWTIVGLLSFTTLLTPFTSSILAPGIPFAMADFGTTSLTVGSLSVTIYLIGYAIGPLFLAPLSEIYGRKPVQDASNAVFCAFQIGCARAPNMGALIAFRLLTGIGGAGCVTLGAGVIADVFRLEQRGLAMGFYTLGPLIGPSIGPLIGGFVAETIGWRWGFWITFIASTVVCSLAALLGRETNPRVLIERKVARLQAELGRDDLRSCYEAPGAAARSPRQVLANGLVRPMRLLFLSPMVFMLSLYIAFEYGVLYLLFTTITTVFTSVYGWNIGVSGLVYISIGLGYMVGWAIVTATSDRHVVRATRRNNGVFEPEMRLPITMYLTLLVPITFFWYGWSAEYKTAWIVPVIGLFPYSVGLVGLFIPILTYLVDCYPMYAASVIAANTVMRSLVGAVLPLAGPAMYKSLGYGWGNSLLGFLSIAMLPLPALFYKYGKRIRESSKLEL